MTRRLLAQAVAIVVAAGLSVGLAPTVATAAPTSSTITATITGKNPLAPGEWTWIAATHRVDGRAAGSARLILQQRTDGAWQDVGTLTITDGRGGRGVKASATTTYRLRTADGAVASDPFVISVATPAPEGPGAGGVGVPAGTKLKVHDGNLTITTPGTVVDGLDVRGFVRVKAKDVVIKNSIIRGPAEALTGPMALVQSDAGPGTNLLIQDSEIAASHPSRFVDGIVGMGFTLERVDIHTVIDQVKIIGDNVTVDSSRLHGNLFYPAADGHIESHDDNVQIAVGKNISVVNSTLSGTTNAAVMITQDRGPVTNFTFDNNMADDGACTINVAEKAYGAPQGMSITDNVFGTGQRHNRCAVLMAPTTQAVATVTGNTFTDGSSFRVSRGS
jgi:hypothetical protein